MTEKLKGEISLLLYNLCEEAGLIETVDAEEMSIPTRGGRFSRDQLFTIIFPIDAPSRLMAGLVPRMLPPEDWRRASPIIKETLRFL